MFEELLKQWANEQGFQTWSQDHAAVLRNLVSWLNSHAVEQPLAPDVCSACKGSGIDPNDENLYCEPCGGMGRSNAGKANR